MDINNSMTLNKSKSSKKNSKPDEEDIMMSMVVKPKSEVNNRITKLKNFKIVCKNNPKKIFETISDELCIHIISCNYCQKELLLYQAKQIRLENQLLNDKKEALEQKRRRRRKDVNDTMTDINLNEDSYDDEEDYEGDDYSEEYNEEADYEGEYEELDNDTSMIGGLDNNKKKDKSKKIKKDDEREKISECDDEENSNDEDNFEDYFLNVRKKKKEEKKKYEENEEYEEEEEEGEGEYFDI